MINPLTLLTSPLEKGLAAAVAVLLATSASEALVIKYEMNSKTQCVSAVTATNAQTKTVTTAIRNVDNASTQAIQSSVSSSIAADLASLHHSESRPTSSGMSTISGSTASSVATADTPNLATYTADQVSAEACLTAYDVALGWQQWYNQTQLNWKNIEDLNGKSITGSNRSSSIEPTPMENLLVPVIGTIWTGVGMGSKDVRQEQPLRGESDSRPTGDGSRDTRSEHQG